MKDKKTKNLILIGPSGSGKSVIGNNLSELLKNKFIDTDYEILKVTDSDKISTIFSNKGESYFRDLELKIIQSIDPNDNTGLIISTGGGLPAIPGMMEILNNIGVTVYLRASLDTLWKRLCLDPKELDNRPLLKDKGKNGLNELLVKREQIYYSAEIIIDTDKFSVNQVCTMLKSLYDNNNN